MKITLILKVEVTGDKIVGFIQEATMLSDNYQGGEIWDIEED